MSDRECLGTFRVNNRNTGSLRGICLRSLIAFFPTFDLSPVASLHTQLTCLTDGLNWNSPASFRSNHIIGIRGTASILAGSARACQPLRSENHFRNLWRLTVSQKNDSLSPKNCVMYRIHFTRKLAIHVTLLLNERCGLWEM